MADRRSYPKSAPRAYSEADDDDRYSEDFDDDDDDDRSPSPRDRTRNNKQSPRSFFQDRLRGRGRGSLGVYGGRGRGRGKRGRGGGGGRGNSRNSEPADMRRSVDTVTQRVLSASRNKVNDLRNQVEELRIKMKDLAEENKLYKKMQFRQEKALKGFEDKENDLPNILEKHSNEVRTLKENNRRLREKYEKSDRYLRDAEDELERVTKRMKKYKEMVDEKDLKERDELSRKLTKAEIDMEEKDVKIKELTRHLDVLKKNHRHEIGIEGARLKEMKKQMDELNDQNTKLSVQLKEAHRCIDSRTIRNAISLCVKKDQDNIPEREAQLQKTNIYANRAAEDDSLESPTRRIKKKTNSLTDLTPRDKAKFYADKKREEFKKQKEQKELKEEQERKKREKWEKEEREKQKKQEDQEKLRKEQERKEEEKYKWENQEPDEEKEEPRVATPPEFSFKSLDMGLEKREEEERLKRDKEMRLRREKQEQDRREKEELEKKRKELEKRQEDNRKRELEDQRQRDREENELRQKKEREERERKEEKERKERLEQERREKEKIEQERRAEQERIKLENDPTIQEERRKKDELLRKLQAMDELGSAGTTNKNASHDVSPVHLKKDISRDGSTTSSERKEYSFTQPTNNLHMGKPARARGFMSKPTDDDSAGGYNPSFGPARTSKPTTSSKPLSIFDDDEPMFKLSDQKSNNASKPKSTNLLENLFGPQATSNKESSKKTNKENETFFITSPDKKQSADTSGTVFPWDSPNKTRNPTSRFNDSDNSGNSALFGGGSALIEDDFSSRSNRVLPRRGRQSNINTFAAKPSVSAVDNFDDDLEEVVL